MDVDSKGFAYLGQNTVRKYDTRTGMLVGEIAHTPDLENGGKFGPVEMPNHTPGVGTMGPVAGFLPPPPGAAGRGGRGQQDPAARAAAIASPDQRQKKRRLEIESGGRPAANSRWPGRGRGEHSGRVDGNRRRRRTRVPCRIAFPAHHLRLTLFSPMKTVPALLALMCLAGAHVADGRAAVPTAPAVPAMTRAAYHLDGILGTSADFTFVSSSPRAADRADRKSTRPELQSH